MAGSALGSVAFATRRTATAKTALKYIGGALLTLGWAAVIADAKYDFLSSRAQLVVLAALIVGSIVYTRHFLIGREVLYKTFCAGRAAEAEAYRRAEALRHTETIYNQRVGAGRE